MDTKKLTAADLEQFTGTESYHPYFDGFILTDGAKYLAEEGKAWWLIDLIFSHQETTSVRSQPFQVWKLTLHSDDNGCDIVAEDGNGNTIARQEIEYTDFPLTSVSVWLIYDDVRGVLMLPSEY